MLPMLLSLGACSVIEPKTETQISYLGFIDRYELQAPSMNYDRDAWPLEQSETSYQRLLASLPAMPLPAQNNDSKVSTFQHINTLELEWIRQLATQGNDHARTHLALLVWQGADPQSHTLEASARRKNALNILAAIKNKDAFAEYLAGAILLAEKPVKGSQYLIQSAAKGYGPAQAALARLYLGENHIPRNDRQAYRYFTDLAHNPRANKTLRTQAHSYLAVMEFFGVGAKADFDKSWDSLLQASLSEELWYLKGLMSAEGLGTVADSSRAISDFERAIAEGSSSAANELAWQKLAGTGSVELLPSAHEHLEQAVSLGSQAAAYNLGLDSLRGNSSPSSVAQAELWFIRAANAGHEHSQKVLAYLQLEDSKWFDFGTGVIDQPSSAVRKELTTLAKAGDSWSSYALGLLWLRGQEGTANLQKGYAWLNVAVALGYRTAAPLRDAAGVQMSRPQLEQAQALSQSLFDGIEKHDQISGADGFKGAHS